MNEAKAVGDLVDLGQFSRETRGVFDPTSVECSTQVVDARDEDFPTRPPERSPSDA